MPSLLAVPDGERSPAGGEEGRGAESGGADAWPPGLAWNAPPGGPRPGPRAGRRGDGGSCSLLHGKGQVSPRAEPPAGPATDRAADRREEGTSRGSPGASASKSWQLSPLPTNIPAPTRTCVRPARLLLGGPRCTPRLTANPANPQPPVHGDPRQGRGGGGGGHSHLRGSLLPPKSFRITGASGCSSPWKWGKRANLHTAPPWPLAMSPRSVV